MPRVKEANVPLQSVVSSSSQSAQEVNSSLQSTGSSSSTSVHEASSSSTAVSNTLSQAQEVTRSSQVFYWVFRKVFIVCFLARFLYYVESSFTGLVKIVGTLLSQNFL